MALHAQMCWKNRIGIARVPLIILDQSVNYVIFENHFIIEDSREPKQSFLNHFKAEFIGVFCFQPGIVTKFPFDPKKLFLRKV